METCKEVHTSSRAGVTTVARCDQLSSHGAPHTAVIAWYAVAPENWHAGDVVVDSHSRIFNRTHMGTWWRPGHNESVSDTYPTRPLVKLVPEQTP